MEPNNKPEESTENSTDQEMIDEYLLLQAQQFARNTVFEPFEGRKSLETVQQTRTNIEKGIRKIKGLANKTGNLITQFETAQASKDKLGGFIKDIKKTGSQRRLSGLIGKLGRPAKSVRQFTRTTYKDLEFRARSLSRFYIRRGLEIIMLEDAERWILKRVNQTFEDIHFTNMEEIRNLSQAQRDVLISLLYPYHSRRFLEFSKRFDLTFNLGLGAIVITNLPGTGIAVSLINMAKTLVKLGNRLNIMFAIYGYQLRDSEALFKASAAILKSLSDWDNNERHTPLDPEILNDLHSGIHESDPDSLKEMIDAIFKKDAYIAIPGVGAISLGKINLDDMKMDLVVRRLTKDYFSKKELLTRFDPLLVEEIISDFQLIYLEFKKYPYFKLARKQKESERIRLSHHKLREKVKMMGNSNLVLNESLIDLDTFSFLIFHSIRSLNVNAKHDAIKTQVEETIQSLMIQP